MGSESGREVGESLSGELTPGSREKILFNFIKSSTENRGEKFSQGRGYTTQFYLTDDRLLELDRIIRAKISERPLGMFESRTTLAAQIRYSDHFEVKFDSINDVLSKLTRKIKIAELELKWSYFDISTTGDASYYYVTIKFYTNRRSLRDKDSSSAKLYLAYEVGGGDQQWVRMLSRDLDEELNFMLINRWLRWFKWLDTELLPVIILSVLGVAGGIPLVKKLGPIVGIDLNYKERMVDTIISSPSIAHKIDLWVKLDHGDSDSGTILLVVITILFFGLFALLGIRPIQKLLKAVMVGAVIGIGESGKVAIAEYKNKIRLWSLGILPAFTALIVGLLFFVLSVWWGRP